MKYNIKIIRIAKLLFLSGLFTFAACNNQIGPSKEDPGVDENVDISANLSKKLGVANFRTTYFSFARSLDLDPVVCKNTFEDVKLSLPQSNDLGTYTTSAMNAVSELASCFCQSMVGDSSARQNIVPTLNFSHSPSQAFATEDAQDAVSDSLIYAFQGKRLATLVNGVEIASDLRTLMSQIQSQESQDSAQTTQRMVLASCIAIGSSFSSSMF